MPEQDTTRNTEVPRGSTRDRREVVRLVYKAEAGRAEGQSVRATAAEEGVSASGLYHYLERASAMDAPLAQRQFFGSPDGVELLHRIVTALHVVFGQAGDCWGGSGV